MSTKQSQNFCLEVDDFGFLMPGLDMLLKIKEHYPNFKITLFTIALPKYFLTPKNLKLFKVDRYKEWVKVINSWDWIEIASHGLYHIKKECHTDYETMETELKAIKNLFKTVGLKYKKIFRAPYWQISWGAYKALRDDGWTVAINREHIPERLPKGLKTYIYNWSFEQKIPDTPLVIGHGHMYRGKVTNDLESCFANILNIPANTEFKFLSEVLKEYGTQN